MDTELSAANFSPGGFYAMGICDRTLITAASFTPPQWPREIRKAPGNKQAPRQVSSVATAQSRAG